MVSIISTPFYHVFTIDNSFISDWLRGVPKLDGARGKKQFWGPNQRSFRSKCSILKKLLATWLGLFGASQWFGIQGIVPSSPPVVAPLHWLYLR